MTHDTSSATRIAVVSPSSARARLRETHADQGTLIMDPDQGTHALATARTLLASQGFAPISVRPSAPSLPDGGIVLEQTASSWTRPKPKADSSFVMLLMAAMAMIAALASIALMASRPDAAEQAPAKATAAAQPVQPVSLPPAPVVVPPPVPAVASPDAIDVDTAPVAKPVPVAAKPAALVTTVAAAPKPEVRPADKKPAKGASADQKKTLEQLLDELGEEQLKR